MSDEHGVDVPMSDCQGEHVGQYKDVPAFVTRDIEHLRDKFALAAITSMILAREFADPEKAYQIADAMLEAKKKWLNISSKLAARWQRLASWLPTIIRL